MSLYGYSQEELSEKAARFHAQTDPYCLDVFASTLYRQAIMTLTETRRTGIDNAFNKHIGPKLGHLDLRQITRQDCQAFVNDLAQKLSPGTVRQVRSILSSILNKAILYDLIQENPASRLQLPALTHGRRALDPAQVRALLSASEGPLRRFAVLTCLVGLRPGEALACGPGDIKNGVLRIQRQVIRLKGGTKLVDRLKTTQSRREIPLPAQILAELACSDALFVPLHPETVNRRLKAHGITPHEGRHSFISIAENDAEIPTPIVARITGKANLSITGGYNHVRPSAMKTALEKVWAAVMEAQERKEA